MTLGIECALLTTWSTVNWSTVFWKHLKGIQDVFSKIFLWCEPMHCSWRELGVQLQKHITHWRQNGQFYNNNGQVEPAKIHPHLVQHNWLFQMLLWSDASSDNKIIYLCFNTVKFIDHKSLQNKPVKYISNCLFTCSNVFAKQLWSLKNIIRKQYSWHVS